MSKYSSDAANRARHCAGPGFFVSALTLLGGVLLVTALWFVYSPGLSGTFFLDDHSNLVNQSALHISEVSVESVLQAVDRSMRSQVGRPIPLASFAVQHAQSGLIPRAYLTWNVLVHLLVTLVALWAAFQLRHTLTRFSPLAALIAVAIWAAHPLHVSTVLYVVQRMTMMEALFALIAIGIYINLRAVPGRSLLQHGCLFVLMLVASFLALLSKENAILIPILLLAFELTVGRTYLTTDSNRQRLTVLLGTVLPSLVLALGLLILLPKFLSGYEYREFSPIERLLTQTRAIWLYIGQLLSPRIGTMTLFHDDFAISTSLLEPRSTLIALVGLIGVLVFALTVRKELPWLSFGILFFFGGHALESTIIPLELVFEHRNYLPSFGLIIGIVFQAHESLLKFAHKLKPAGAVIGTALAAFMCILTLQRAAIWGKPVTLLEHSVVLHPESPRAHYHVAHLFDHLCQNNTQSENTNYCDSARRHYEYAAKLKIDDAGSLMNVARIDARTGMGIDDSLNQSIKSRLTNAPPIWVNVNVLVKMLSDEHSSIPAIYLANWADAALDNPRQRDLGRLAIHVAYSQLLFNRMGLGDFALQQLRVARQIAPDRLDVQIAEIKLLITTMRLEEAEVKLSKARESTQAWSYSKAIDRLDASIRSTTRHH